MGKTASVVRRAHEQGAAVRVRLAAAFAAVPRPFDVQHGLADHRIAPARATVAVDLAGVENTRRHSASFAAGLELRRAGLSHATRTVGATALGARAAEARALHDGRIGGRAAGAEGDDASAGPAPVDGAIVAALAILLVERRAGSGRRAMALGDIEAVVASGEQRHCEDEAASACVYAAGATHCPF